jgi:SEC-C motif-containing protein
LEDALVPCICGIGESTETHCLPIIDGAPAPTAEALMRSRYTAYVLGKIDYIFDSLHPSQRSDVDRSATEQWSKKADWKSLEVVSTEKGGEGDDTGSVEFIARFEMGGVAQEHRELATFRRSERRWYYVDGKVSGQKPVVHEGPRVGRNDPCPCGSGKKYKKCHGVAA